MRSAQHHARRTPRLQRFLPARCAQTPAIIGLQSRKAEFRHRRREIIAAGLRELEKTHGHEGAHGVAAVVLAAGVAAAVAKESRHRAQGADFESIAEHNGSHTVCAFMTVGFLEFSKACGNDLSTPVPEFGFPGLKPDDRWCLCAPRWQEALQAGRAAPVVLRATHEGALSYCSLADLKRFAVDLD